MKVDDRNIFYQNELIFYPYTYYRSFGRVAYPVQGFHYTWPKIKKYSEWLGIDDRIFMRSYIKKPQSHLVHVNKCLTKML